MWRDKHALKRLSVAALKRCKRNRFIASSLHRFNGFALYEVLIGLTIFLVGVLALGRAVENCLNASTLSAEEDRIREILSNRMAEIQTTPGPPDVSKEFKINTGYGMVKLIQKAKPAGLKESLSAQVSANSPGNPIGGGSSDLQGIYLITLTAQWMRGSGGTTTVHRVERTENVMAQSIRDYSSSAVEQSRTIEFYVYRPS